MKKLSKTEAKEKVEYFFSHIKGKIPEEIKKMKKLAMKNNIPLGNKRKLFCKKCFISFNPKNHRVRIKEGKKIITCKECKYIARMKIK